MAYNPGGVAQGPGGPPRAPEVFSLETFEAAVDLVTNPPRADAGPEAAAAVARATAYIQQLSAHPQAHIVVLQVLMSAKKAETRFFCFQALESYVSSRAYMALGMQGRTEVRQALLHWLASRGGGDPFHNLLAQEAKYVRGKLAVVLGYLVKYDYPEVWPTAFGDLLAACTATSKQLTSPTPGSGPAVGASNGLAFSGLDLFLQVLGVVDTEVADPHINRPKAELDHNMLVKDQMRGTAVMGNLVDHWLSLLLQYGGLPTAGGEPPLATLAGIRICRQVLQLVARYIAWFDVKTVANDRFMPVLLQFITAPAPRVVPLMACANGVPPPPAATSAAAAGGRRPPHPLRAAAVGVIRALLHKGMDDLQRLMLIRGGQTVEMLASVLGTPGAIAVSDADNGLDGVEGGSSGPGDDVGATEDSEEFGLETCRLLASVGQALLVAGESCPAVVQDAEACAWTAAALRAAVSMSMQILLQEDVQCATEVMPFLMTVIQAFSRERRAAAAAEAASHGGSSGGGAGGAIRSLSSPGMLGSPSPTLKGQSGTSPSLPPGTSSSAFLAPAAGPGSASASDRSAAGGPDGVHASSGSLAAGSSGSSGKFAMHLSSPPPPSGRARPRATSGVGDGSSASSSSSAACPGYEGRPAGVSFMEAMPRLLDIIAQRVAFPIDFQVNPPSTTATSALPGGGPGGQLSIIIPSSGGDGDGDDDEEDRVATLRLRDDLKRAFSLIVRTAPEASIAHLTTLDEGALAAAGGTLPIGAGGFLAPARLASLPSQPWNQSEAALSALFWIGDAAPTVMATLRLPGGGHLYQALATVFSSGLPEQVAPAAAAFNEAVAAARAALPPAQPPRLGLPAAAAGPRLPPHLSLAAAAKVGGVTVPVLLQYYELAVRFFPVLCSHTGALQRMFEAMVGPAGLLHPSPMIRSRCAYLLAKLVRAIATSDAHAEQVSLGAQLPLLLYRLEPMLTISPPVLPASGWQATPVPTTGSLGVSGGLGHSDHQHIFETVGTLLAQTWIPADKRLSFTQTVLTPLLRALEAGLTEVETRRAAAGGGAGGAGGAGAPTAGVHPDIITWTYRVLHTIGQCIKGFSRGSVESCPGLLALIETAVGGAVKAVSVVPNETSIRLRASMLLHKMVDVVATQPDIGRTLDFMGRVWPLLLSSAAPEDVSQAMVLANQIMSKYRNEAGAFIAAIFVPTVTRALQVLPAAAATTTATATAGAGAGRDGVVTPRSEARLLVTDEARARNEALKALALFLLSLADTTPTLAARVLCDPTHCRPQMWEILTTVCRACMTGLLVDLGPARTALSLLIALVRSWLPVSYPTAASAAAAAGSGATGGSGAAPAPAAPAPAAGGAGSGHTAFPPARSRAMGPGGTVPVTGPPVPLQSPLVSVAGDPSAPGRFIQFLAEVALPLSWSVCASPVFDAGDSQSIAAAADLILFQAVAAVHVAAHTSVGAGGSAPAIPLPGCGPAGMDVVGYMVAELLPRPPFLIQPTPAATYAERLRRYIGVLMSVGATLAGVSAGALLDAPLKETRTALFGVAAGIA